MPYININEYDYTITGPKTIGGNIVAIPINASDGPSDKWITVHTYEDFIQLFGDNPDPNGTFGNSWEYAANLLLRNMSVCVRRITNVLDDDGMNTTDILPGVSTAKGIIKVKDIINDDSSDGRNLVDNEIEITEPNLDNTILISSDKGVESANDLYKQNTYVEEAEVKTTAFPYPLALELATNESELPGTFADVSCTNSEWNYIGNNQKNPHYKDEYATMNAIKAANPEGILGDFYINEDNHVVKYVSKAIPNNYLIQSQKVYPSELVAIDTSNLTKNHFVEVIYDATNENAVKKVWLYTPDNKTTVANYKFVKNPQSEDGLFENKDELDAMPNKNFGDGYFAGVKSTNTICVFADNMWLSTADPISDLNGSGDYGKTVDVPFSITDSSFNTGIYRHEFNWENVGESGETYIDTEHKELVFTKEIHWVNSLNPIGSRPHIVLKGAVVNLNKIIINAMGTLNKTSIDLQYTGIENNVISKYFNGNLVSDTSENKLTSGKTGFTNYGTEPINIYGLKILQKDEYGNTKELYNAGLEKILTSNDGITSDPLLQFKDVDGNIIDIPTPKLDSTTSEDKWYIELPAGASLYYNVNLSGTCIELMVAGFDKIDLSIHTFKSSNGEYRIDLSSINNEYVSIHRLSLPSTSITEDINYDNIPVNDGHGNINLFIAEYLYPGTNGNFINLKVQTIQNRGIYIYVYRNNQYLEKIDLCNFRRRTSNGRVTLLDMDLNKTQIWKSILNEFNIRLPYNNTDEPQPIYGNYVKISLNENILKENPESLDYVSALFGETKDISNGVRSSNVVRLQNGTDPLDEHVKHEISKCYEPLKDKYRFDIKFVTNGSFVDDLVYPSDIMKQTGTREYRLIEDAMIDLAETRKDCVTFLDVPYYLPLDALPQYFSHLSTSYAAAYDPWGYIGLETGSVKWMPPSFIQLYVHAKSIQNGNKMYLPPAGVKRAQIPELLKTNHDIPSKYIDEWQNSNTPQFINPIIWINGYDYTIYGQKTLFNVINGSDRYQSALQDLNVRLVANEVKKLIWKTCINLTFELNALMTWNEFKSKIEPMLSTMLGEGTLTDYSIIMGTETMTKADLNSGHVVGTVRISVARAATDWDINVEITPNNVTFNEYDYNSSYEN